MAETGKLDPTVASQLLGMDVENEKQEQPSKKRPLETATSEHPTPFDGEEVVPGEQSLDELLESAKKQRLDPLSQNCFVVLLMVLGKVKYLSGIINPT